ncbi:hypothetical protein AOLI_G00229280 [Acnodon oligacanthus]
MTASAAGTEKGEKQCFQPLARKLERQHSKQQAEKWCCGRASSKAVFLTAECCSNAEFRVLLIRNSVMLLGSASCRPPAAAPRSAKQRRPS